MVRYFFSVTELSPDSLKLQSDFHKFFISSHQIYLLLNSKNCNGIYLYCLKVLFLLTIGIGVKT